MKVVFTDSGLGGITIMADFVHRAKENAIPMDVVFFNAQYSHDLGYKKMDSVKQVEIFERVLQSIEKKYKPDIIAVACNTLSVVCQKTNFYKTSKTKVLDIINTGKSLINKTESNAIIEVAMPTTINSEVYKDFSKKRIAIPSDTSLPNAIENGYQQKIDTILSQVFQNAKQQIRAQNLTDKKIDLFLGCTHFPIIKDLFLEKATDFGVDVKFLLNPNTAFSKLVLKEVAKNVTANHLGTNSIEVVSRMPFRENEVKNIAAVINKQSLETAEALKSYTYKTDLF